MSEDFSYYLLVVGFLFVTTILFIAIDFVLSHQVTALNERIRQLESQRESEKRNTQAAASPLKLLKPYESETSRSIIISVNTKYEVTYVNDYAEEFFGFSREELMGKNVFDTIYIPQDVTETGQHHVLERVLENPQMYMEHENENRKKNDERVWISWTNRVVYDENGEPSEIRSVGFDITRRKQLEFELRSLSDYDSLTGVYNRQSFLKTGVKELKRAVRYKRQLTLVIMRLDFFHDLQSHREFTDEILKDIVDTCRKSIRESDTIGRLNDVEFGFLLPETPIENAAFLIEQLRKKVQEYSLKRENEFFVNALFGMAEKERADSTIDSLISRAFDDLEKNAKTKSVKSKRKGA